VTGTTPSPTTSDVFAALLRSEDVPWGAFAMTPAAFLRECRERDVTGLVWEQRRRQQDAPDWPPEICAALDREVRAELAGELLRQRELMSVLAALAAEDISPILLKGTALAYGVYNNPASRPRIDTDLLIRRDQADPVRRVMAGCGYMEPTHCDGDFVFGQFPLKKTDEFGLVHSVDFHWRISTQSVFADVLTFDEVAAVAVDLPALGTHARAAGPVHALLLACVHPVMHHRNAESLVWIHDIHLLASQRSEQEFDHFAELAVVRKVSAICGHQLGTARRWFGTRVPDSAMRTLDADRRREPSAGYLRPNRHRGNDLISCMRGLPRWSDRWRLLREVTLPAPTYMLKTYGVSASALGAASLPVLYLHRLWSGSWKVLARRD
jgi:hypothetical protein